MELAPDERAVAERAVRAGLVAPDALRHGLALRAQLAARGRRVPVEAVVEALAAPGTGRLPGPDALLLRRLLAAGPAWAQALDPLLRAEVAPTVPPPRAHEDVTPTVGAPPPAREDATPTVPPPLTPTLPRAAPPRRPHDALAAAAQAAAAAFQVDPRFAPMATLALEPLGELGRGGMGVVLRVRDRRLDRLAALKLLHEADDPRAVQRFIREAEVTARLDHPAIPPVYEAGVDALGRHYLLMRLVGGEPLKRRIEGWHAAGHPPGEVSRELVEALVRVGEAVAYAHGEAVIHRDLKPANVMVGEFGEVLVMDWGLAALDAAERAALAGAARALPPAPDGAPPGEPLTVQGSVLGTPGYMPPEQAAGEELDARADVFALGAMLCELLAGRPPISGATSLEKVLRTVQGKIARPSELRPGVPAELDDLAARALAPDPARRLPTAAAFVRELRAWLAGEDLESHRYGARERALRAIRRRPARAVALAAAALLLLVAGGAAAQVQAAARRAADEVRARAIEEARDAAARALAAFEAAPFDSRTGLGLAAVQAAQRWHDLDRTPAAAQARAAAATALAAVASDSRQWDLAIEAHRLALGLGRDAQVEAAVAAVASARTAETREHVARVERYVGQARAGELGGVSLEDAVVAASRWREPEVVRTLVAELDRLTLALRSARRELLLRVGQPKPEELQAGEVRIDGLGDALRALDEGPRPLTPAGPVRAALERVARRTAQVTGRDVAGGVAAARQSVASEQERALGHDPLARLLLEVLGRLGGEGVVPALARYLRAEEGAGRATLAVVALCRLDTPAAVAEALRAREGFEARSELGLRSLALLQRSDVEPEFAPGDPDGPRLRAELRSLRARAGEDGTSAWDALVAARPDDPTALDGRARARLRAGDLAGSRADARRAVELAPERAAGWALLGELLGRAGDAEGAAQALDRAIALAPDEAGPWQSRALTRDLLGDPAKAVDDYARAVERDAGLALCWERLVGLRTALGLLPQARADADAAVRAVPGHGPVWRARAELRLADGDLPGARADAEAAVERGPADAHAWAARARARGRAGDVAGAQLDAEVAARLAPEDPRVLRCLADCLSALGARAEAMQAAERLVQVDRADPAAWALLSRLCFEAGDRRGSLVAAEQGARVAPRDARALVARARARHRLGDLAGAEADCEEALGLDARLADAWLARGEARFAAKRPGADADVDRAVELAPDHVEARRTRAALRAARDDLAGALADLDHAVDVAPGELDLARDRGQLRHACGDHAGARDALARLLAIRPRDPVARTYLGLSRLALGDLEGARADLDRAVEELPASRLARAGRCAVRDKVGDLPGCLEDASLLLEGAPDDPPLRLLRARVQARLGATPAAVADLEHLLRVAPRSAEAEAAQALLTELRGR